MAVWHSLWPFGIFFRFGMFAPRKSGNPDTTYIHIGNDIDCLMMDLNYRKQNQLGAYVSNTYKTIFFIFSLPCGRFLISPLGANFDP
jgi:hypothetical protein